MLTMARSTHPRVSVYCRCGAQWHGQHAVNNPVVDYHANSCGAPVSEQDYIRLTGRPPHKPWKDDARRDT